MGDWFSWNGTLDKDEYTKRALIALVGAFILSWVPVLGWLAGLALIFTLGCSMARRCRATGLTPWLGVLAILPLANVLVAVYLIVRD